MFGTSGHRGSSPQHELQRGPHRRDHPGDRRLPHGQGIAGPAVPRPRHARPLAARPSAARSRCSSRTASTCSSTRATRGCRPRRSATRSSPTTAAGRSMTRAAADGIVVTPSHNPPRDGGFKYNPPNGGPGRHRRDRLDRRPRERADRRRARGRRAHARSRTSTATRSATTTSATRTCATSRTSSTSRRSSSAGVRIGADPLGGASVEYWALIAEVLRPRPHGREPRRRPDVAVHDARLGREDPHGPVVARRRWRRSSRSGDDYDILTGNDADADRHGIVTPDAGPDEPEPLPRGRDRLPLLAPAGLARGCRDRQDARSRR